MYLAVGMAANWPIIGEIAWLLGRLMSFIFDTLARIGIESVGITIIVFTIIILMAMLPLTIKQQKNMRMSAITQPEIQAVQKKYQGKRDQASMMKQQEEMKLIHEKYGTSATGGCLPMLIQMPILFALFPVIQSIPRYVDGVARVYEGIIDKVYNSLDYYQAALYAIANEAPANLLLGNYIDQISDRHYLELFFYRFQELQWETLAANFPDLSYLINDTMHTLHRFNYFLGINLAEAPWTMLQNSLTPFNIIGILLAAWIPIASGLTQFLSVKLNPTPAPPQGQAGNIQSSMQKMILIMPLFSVFIGFTMPAGLGLYWAVSALVRSAQQFVINRRLKKIPMEEMIRINQEKAAKKRLKKGVKPSVLSQMATQATRNMEEGKGQASASTASNKANVDKNLPSSQSSSNNAKPGSLAARASMVSRYNSGQSGSNNEKKAEAVKEAKDEKGKDKTHEK